MIIGAYKHREIGEIVPNGVITEFPADTPREYGAVGFSVAYRVLRHATEAAWIEEQKRDGAWGPVEQFRYFFTYPKPTHWYEVSVD